MELTPALLLCDAASRGDISRLRELAKDHDVSAGDYDRRTVRHSARLLSYVLRTPTL